MPNMPDTHRIRNGQRMMHLLWNAVNHGGHITCEYCSEITHNPEIDHFVPRAKGGAIKDDGNLLVACPDCNKEKGEKYAEDVFNDDHVKTLKQMLITRVFSEEIVTAGYLIARIHKKASKRREAIAMYCMNDDNGEVVYPRRRSILDAPIRN